MTITGLQLTLSAADRLPLDEPLVAIVRLVNQGAEPVTVSSRLNLAEDLSVTVTGPGRAPARAAWPWPVDSGLRQVRLAPGEVLEAGVLPLLADGAVPLFPVAGAYTLVAEFIPTPGKVVRSAPVTVVREEPLDSAARARLRALEDPQAARSIASGSLVGAAADALTGPIAETPTGRLLAALATVTRPRCCHPASIQETSGSQRSAQPWRARTTTAARPPCWPSAPGDRPEGDGASGAAGDQVRAAGRRPDRRPGVRRRAT
jgi:hypothetical protein